MSRRPDPTVFLAMISPVTVAIVVGIGAVVGLATGSWAIGVLAGAAAWIARVAFSRLVAGRLRSLEPRIDPFALREPWRFFVRDALAAQRRFAEALADAEDGPLRHRLLEIESQLSHAVEVTWDVARRGQQLTDAKNRIDQAKLRRTLDSIEPGDPRHASARAQLDAHERLRAREEATRERLEVIEARLDETITRVGELATRTGGTIEVEQLAGRVDGMVDELDSLRIALDEVGNET